MKYSLAFSFCFLFLIQSAAAQFKQGTMFVGGSLGGFDDYSPNKDSIEQTQNNCSSEISPIIGYYYNDHSAVGLSFTYDFEKNDNEYLRDTTFTQQTHTYSIEVSPFWRYNKPLTDRWGLFGAVLPNIRYSVSDGSGEDRD